MHRKKLKFSTNLKIRIHPPTTVECQIPAPLGVVHTHSLVQQEYVPSLTDHPPALSINNYLEKSYKKGADVALSSL